MKHFHAALAATFALAALAGCNQSDNSPAPATTSTAPADTTASTAPADTTASTAPASPTPTEFAGVPKIKMIGKPVTLPDGLVIEDTKIGTGASPTDGQTVTVNYVGMLTDGTVFDASAKHGGTFDFPIGQGQVIKGWDEGVKTMKIGGSRRLIIPSSLGYGPAGTPGGPIPPDATLVFDIDLKNAH